MNNRKIVILMSGGLDSTVCAAMACTVGKEVTLAFFNYNQRMYDKELKATINIYYKLWKTFKNNVKIIFKEFNAPYLSLDVDSYLTNFENNVIENDESLLSPTAWVAGRNLAMIAQVASWAEINKYDEIWIGTNKEEGETYPDNTEGFIVAANDILSYSSLRKLKVVAPLLQMNKIEIVKIGKKINAPMLDSWSCYHNYDKHCGKCGSCLIKKAAFEKVGFVIPKDYWEN